MAIPKYASLVREAECNYNLVEKQLNTLSVIEIRDLITRQQAIVRYMQQLSDHVEILADKTRNLVTNKVDDIITISTMPDINVLTAPMDSINPRKQVEVANNVCIFDVKTINDWDEVPNTNMYYNTRDKKFGFKIANVLFTGNIGTIYPKYGKKVRVFPCTENCTDDEKKCNNYHPTDSIRNFLDSNISHSRDTLYNDILAIKRLKNSVRLQKIELLRNRLMHDLLVYLGISANI